MPVIGVYPCTFRRTVAPGVRTTHEDFQPASRVALGWNFVGCTGVVNDESGHGTHTAGTALGLTSGMGCTGSLT